VSGVISGAASAAESLSQADVERVISQAATEAKRRGYGAVIAVTDREGFMLGLWDVNGRLPATLPAFDLTDLTVLRNYGLAAGAVTRASTSAFLSSNENALTSRTAGFIVQQHFPPGVRNTPNGPLVGVGFSNLFFSAVNRVKLITADVSDPVPDDESPGARTDAFPPSSLNDSPGGVPLYKNGELVGGVGVTGDGSPTDLAPAAAVFFNQTQPSATTGFKGGSDVDELVALAGQTGFRPSSKIVATNVLVGGIRLPYVGQRVADIRDLRDPEALATLGNAVDVTSNGVVISGSPTASPAPYPYVQRTLGGYEGEVRFTLRADPRTTEAGHETIGGAARLTLEEVEGIISRAAARAKSTRAAIRLPVGTSAKVFITVVNNPDEADRAPDILGIFRTGDGPIFSWDVSAQKAFTAVFFSNRQIAQSCRTVGFMAQRYYPPGLDGRSFGPLFGFQEAVSLRQSTDPLLPFPPNPNLPNGVTIFPGGFPLYRDGKLVGAIGVSGDGIDQDDIISASGCGPFVAPEAIRADRYTYRGARLPYAKFPRDPAR